MDPRIVVNTQEIEKVIPALHEAVSDSREGIEGATPLEQARFLAVLRGALDDLRAAQKRPGVLASPPNPVAALVQSLIVSNATDLIQLTNGALEAKFDSDDWFGWATVLWHMVKDARNRFRWQEALVQPETTPQFGNDALVAFFGDWGTGMYGAPAIRDTTSANDAWKFVMHLGDVYYSGTVDEYKARFSNVWPTRPGALNRALNGNHEMYSGGRPYFDTIQQPPFGQTASYFAYQNDKWIVAGLDTAYGDKVNDDHNITDGQVNWLKQIVASTDDRKIVLFSHHQPFSLLSGQGPKLQAKLGGLLETGKIFAWYWGHEHECVIYDRHPKWNLYGRCIGHAGMPEFRPVQLGSPVPARQLRRFRGTTAEQRGDNLVEVPDSLILDGPNPLIKDQETDFSPHGFAVLEFHGKKLTEHYLDPDGTEFHTIDLE